MNTKEEEILKEIINYVYENSTMPTRRYLQRKMGFKSVNSISEYIKSLERKNYLIRNSDKKLILDNSAIFYQQHLKTIKVINMINTYVKIIINKNKNYIAYKIHNNSFNYLNIQRNDILIIEMKKKLKPGEIGLFMIDKKYRVMTYDYKDGFYILKDKEKLLLSKVIIVGKVVMIERKLWDISKF